MSQLEVNLVVVEVLKKYQQHEIESSLIVTEIIKVPVHKIETNLVVVEVVKKNSV